MFIAEQLGAPLETYPILWVADSETFSPVRTPDFVKPFTAEHWGVVEALLRDPDGRCVSLHGPLSPGVVAPDADAHHQEKYS